MAYTARVEANMHDDDQPVGKILTRREALRLAALSGFGFLAGGAKALGTDDAGPVIDLVVTPELTEGPFFINNKLDRKNVLGMTRRKSVTEGLPLKLKIKVYGLGKGKPEVLKGAQVDIWQADTIGSYSGEPSSPIQAEDTTGQDWLRGYQDTNAEGECEFETIFPGWYLGRTTHIHFKIRVPAKGGSKAYEFTSQWFFDDSVNSKMSKTKPYRGGPSNKSDGIYSAKQADGSTVGSHLHLKTRELGEGKGLEGTFSVGMLIP